MKTSVSALMMIAALVIACGDAEADTIVDRDIVLAMPFDEGRGETTKDLSPHGNHGTFKRNAKWGKGKFGNAVQFEPVGYVDAGNDESLNLLKSDFTLAMWINMNETLFGHRHAFIAQDEGPGFLDKWILGYSLHGNPTLNILKVVGDGAGGASFGRSFLWEVQPQTWHQVAIVRDRFPRSWGEEHTIYLDGKQVARFRIPSNITDDFTPRSINAPVTIGFAEEDIWLDGLIDEVLIAKRAFTEDEITAHFQGGIKRGLGLAVHPNEQSAVAWGSIKANILH